MRPLELSVRGFRSYRDLATFDWRGRRLVGVVGPIGSGKSTLLDAVAFSLFGKTPTFERDTKSLIHQLSDECHVELRFEVDRQIWRAVRSLRRKGQAGHQLQRLTDDGPDAEVLETVVGEKLVRQRVEQLLGMDFDAFCRSVLLAQNRFADFLRATPTQRNEVLKGVFGYERFDAAHVAAKIHSAAAELAAASLEDERGRLSETREQLATANAELTTATARTTGLRDARARVDELAGRRRLAQDSVARADERLAQLGAVAEALPDQERAGAVLDAAARADDALDEAEQAAARAETERTAAEATLAAVAERVGDQARFSALVRSLEHHAQTAEERGRHRDELAAARDGAVAAARAAEDAAEAAEGRSAAASAALAAAESGVRSAEEQVHESRHADMAMTLRASLEPGAPCPVCDRPVAVAPPVDSTPGLEVAEAALADARRQAEQRAGAAGPEAAEAAAARERATGAAGNVERIETELARAVESFAAAESELEACKGELVDHLGSGDPHELLAARGAELEAAEHDRARATEAAATARAEVERVRTATTEAGSALARLATELAAAWGRLGEARTGPEGPEALRADLAALGVALEERREEASVLRATSGADVVHADEATTSLLVELGLDPGADFADALADAAAKEAATLERVASLDAILAEAADLDQRAAAAQVRLELTRRLASDLQPSRFLAFLLEEERAALGQLGSIHLEELTGGAYRFTDDDRFDVVDLNAAGSERRADSLSGGETFLASLALALALAEMVARGGGRLDAFFLDEGFGSLDPEHLDRALEGIGRLVAGGVEGSGERLVVLVSHVEQMRQMVEDLIVLDKDDLTGDTIVRSGAVPS